MKGMAVVIALSGLAFVVPGEPRSVGGKTCSMRVSYAPQRPETVAVLAVAMPDSLFIPAGRLPAAVIRHGVPEIPGSSVFGQAFDVLAVSDKRRPPGRSLGRHLVVVPWGYGPDCVTIPWEASAVWVPPGDTVLFVSLGERYRDPVDGSVFHVLGWHHPYPGADLARFAASRSRSGDEWMSPRDVLEMLDELPPYPANDDLSALRKQFDKWARSHPRLARQFPASAIADWLNE